MVGRAGAAPRADLALISLSRGGADAVVVREFDLESLTFKDDADGFRIEEAKTDIGWIDAESVFVEPISATARSPTPATRDWQSGGAGAPRWPTP